MSDKYILGPDGKTPVPCDDLLKWAEQVENRHRTIRNRGKDPYKVAHTEITDEVCVSTVFLGLDHSFRSVGRPILFETMVFGGDKGGEMELCSTWEEAEKQHRQMVEQVKKSE